MENNYLVHHGILGQKWGRKNGPPYPLDFNKLSKEEREKAKRESIEKGDIRTANANRDYYSNQELNELINRFDLNSRLSQKVSSLDKDKIEAGIKRVEKVTNTVRTVSNLVGTVGDATNNVKKLKDAFDKVMGVDENKKNYAFDQKKLDAMLKDPDKFSDEEWKKVNDRLKNFSAAKTMSDKLKSDKVDADIEKIMDEINEKNRKESSKKKKKEPEGPLTGKVEGKSTSSYASTNKFVKDFANKKFKSANTDAVVDAAWNYVEERLALAQNNGYLLEDKRR